MTDARSPVLLLLLACSNESKLVMLLISMLVADAAGFPLGPFHFSLSRLWAMQQQQRPEAQLQDATSGAKQKFAMWVSPPVHPSV